MTNRLSIRAPHFAVQLEGEASFVGEAYAAIRPRLLAHVAQRLAPSAEPEAGIPVPAGDGRQAIRIAICHDVYRRLYAAPRQAVQRSELARQLDIGLIRDIFIERNARELAVHRLNLDAPLWSELVPRRVGIPSIE